MLLLDFKALTVWFYNNCKIMNHENGSYICLDKNNIDDDTLSFT